MQGWHLGLGLLSIGRAWGVRAVEPPSETNALALLETACTAGIRFFDTAPAYGSSERILGKFLRANPHRRPTLTIATKMGEQWDPHTQTSHVSHTYDALSASLDASLHLLERIDVLQVHKATTENITSPAVLNVLERARNCGIRAFGASVSDLDTAWLACRCGHYQYIQFPFNTENTNLQAAFDAASQHDVQVLVNRPLAMGKIAVEAQRNTAIADAYGFITRQAARGIILMGTSSPAHLQENVQAFRKRTEYLRA